MKVPSWESSAGALASLLNGTDNRQLLMVDLYTITTRGGLALRYTDAQLAVTVNGNTFVTGPLIKRGRTRTVVGIEVDTLDLTIAASSAVTVNSVPLLQFIARRGLDDARLVLERAFSPGPGQAFVGTLELFSGRISSPRDVTRLEARLAVNSDTELLDIQVPRNAYQPPCMNTLYDPACGVSRAAHSVTGTAASVSDASRIYFTHSLAAIASTYDLGVVAFTSGANAGVTRTVRRYETVAGSGVNRITLMAPLPAAVAIGDAFSISKGCDRRQSTCSGVFSNIARFRGTPYVPTPEAIL